MNGNTARMIVAVALIATLLGCACLAQEKKTVEVTGKVLLPDGKPASRAVVGVYWPRSDETATTDASGAFKMELAPGGYYFKAKLAPYAMISQRETEVKSPPVKRLELVLKLHKGVRISGKVIDKTTGAPVAGARVVTTDRDEVTTAQDGTFVFDALPRTENRLIAMKEGYYWPTTSVGAAEGGKSEVIFETKPQAVIRGKVTNEKGEPIAKALVEPAQTRYFDFVKARTDENGEYVLGNLDPDAEAGICVSARAYKDGYASGITFDSATREAKADVQLTKTPVRTITGRVTAQDGAPVTDALVAYGWTDCAMGYKTTRSGPDGRFELKDVGTGRNIVVAEAAGLAPAMKFVEEGKPAGVELKMLPGHSLEGKFIDEEGKSVEGVRVGISIEDPEMKKMKLSESTYRWVTPKTSSGKDGRFKLENLPAGRIFIETYLPGYSRIDRMPLQVDRKDHVIKLSRPGVVAGKVVQASDGKPIRKFTVYARYGSRGTQHDSPDGTFAFEDDTGGPPGAVGGHCRSPRILPRLREHSRKAGSGSEGQAHRFAAQARDRVRRSDH